MRSELRTGDRVHRVGAVEAQRRVRHRDRADLVVLDVLEETALMHVRIVHDLADIAHRGQRDAVPAGDREYLELAEGLRPGGDQRVGFLAIFQAGGGRRKARVVA